MSTMAEWIVRTATSRGIDPVDLATTIAFETAGSFDPAQPGPTTKWGRHVGLIQMGEPQRKEYGYDPNGDLGSQFAAIGRYLDKAGVKPGASLLDIYPAINAGSVGRPGAVDMGTTVAQKVAGMQPFRDKALRLLAGTWTPSASRGYSGAENPQTPATGQAAPIDSLIGSSQRSPMEILSQLAQSQSQPQQQEAPDPRQMFEANYAWARRNGWTI